MTYRIAFSGDAKPIMTAEEMYQHQRNDRCKFAEDSVINGMNQGNRKDAQTCVTELFLMGGAAELRGRYVKYEMPHYKSGDARTESSGSIPRSNLHM